MPEITDAAPQNPLETIAGWLAEATSAVRQRNPNAMSLATVDGSGRPAARMVLLKALHVQSGYCVFYTHYNSRKGRELAHNRHAAAVLYWPEPGRQVRFEGVVVKSPANESDAYFASRPTASQLNAWVSEQSQTLDAPDILQQRLAAKPQELGEPDATRGWPRPPFWGGYRLWFESVELWTEGQDRFHERVRYERNLSIDDGSITLGPWQHRHLQP
jgi:pyridoxamine 5'-phosphate oxidase